MRRIFCRSAVDVKESGNYVFRSRPRIQSQM